MLDPLLHETLDAEHECSARSWSLVGDTILRALRDEQRRIAQVAEAATSEVEFTVSVAIWGERRVGCIQLGDSAILVARDDGSVSLALPRQEGEYAGETNFLSHEDTSIARATYGLLAAETVVAILALSDGVAHAWLDTASNSVAPGVRTVVERLRSGQWDVAQLRQHLLQPFWAELPDDDRSVAYAVYTAVPAGVGGSSAVLDLKRT